MLLDEFEIEQNNFVVVVSFDTHQASLAVMQELTATLMERVRYDGARHFILDMAGVEFLSSSCLGCLVEFQQDINSHRGRVALAHCHPNVEFLFKVTRLDVIFPLYEDVEEAQMALSA